MSTIKPILKDSIGIGLDVLGNIVANSIKVDSDRRASFFDALIGKDLNITAKGFKDLLSYTNFRDILNSIFLEGELLSTGIKDNLLTIAHGGSSLPISQKGDLSELNEVLYEFLSRLRLRYSEVMAFSYRVRKEYYNFDLKDRFQISDNVGLLDFKYTDKTIHNLTQRVTIGDTLEITIPYITKDPTTGEEKILIENELVIVDDSIFELKDFQLQVSEKRILIYPRGYVIEYFISSTKVHQLPKHYENFNIEWDNIPVLWDNEICTYQLIS
jgi:hypothetical protein